MAEHPIIMDEKKQVHLFLQNPGQRQQKPAVIDEKPTATDPKKSLAQRLSKYAFGEEVVNPGNYVWKSYLEPTGKRVANDILEHFLMMIKHTFQRWLWDGKILDNNELIDRTSFSNYGRRQDTIQAAVKMSPVKDITFATRSSAEKVLNELKRSVNDPQEGNCVTVRAYYEAANLPELCDGVSSSSGWTSMDKVEVKPCSDGDGFYITLPRPIGLKARQ